MTIDLAEPRAKVKREEEHLNTPYDEIETFFESAAGPPRTPLAPTGPDYLHRVSSSRPPKPLCVLPLRSTIARVHARKSPEKPARRDGK